MTPQVIAAFATAIVAVLTAVGTLLHSVQTRRQVNSAPSQQAQSNTGTPSWPDQHP